MSVRTVAIDSLGAKGDGIATSPDGPLFVPFSLPGETVGVAVNGAVGTLMSIAKASPERQEPPCRHFGPDGVNGTCGGCTLQHAADPLYHMFKRQLVIDALASKGIQTEVAPLIPAAPGERRRVVLTARRTEKALLLGYNQMSSHHLVHIEECPIASPGIVGRLDAIRRIALALASNAEPFRITVLEVESGLDLSVDGVAKLDNPRRRRAVEAVLALRGISRLSVGGEVIVEPIKPIVRFGTVPVTPPPGSFTQATRKAEAAMAELVLDALGKAKRVADLFSGSGTFALRIAARARVHAVESDEKALKALDAAARSTQGLKPVTVERRDLFRRPLMTSELKPFDALVFDPPRAGAEAQMAELARSSVKTVVAVSCNPLTLARDLALLIAGGYRLKSVTPIDQFLWSAHVEAVAVLEK
ncbi:RNA methyltransferase [Xaviernesmea oryzae]|uniref:RNA methyltransferase n=1 Tax=Xaviernesmea oryzae TaxID=464029 RepID=A0A1Q9ATD8_9HYPH|nr:class I SAM-dependent RNA methyltransferase [Xaviernesmea oryzae]OLP58694.1 RNA methyltransferase [Xaviernesmea oryzae]SEK68415.1 23S rRNA (uracil1939-C5)-methyltransferase [Xaviernesmea oryzae]